MQLYTDTQSGNHSAFVVLRIPTTNVPAQMNFQEYLKFDAINASGLRLMLPPSSPLKYWDERINPDRIPPKESDAFKIGSALHGLMFEDKRVWRTMPSNIKRTTVKGREDYQEWLSNLPEGTLILSEQQEEVVETMYDTLLSNEEALELLQDNGDVYEKENNLVFNFGLNKGSAICKARLDLIKVVDGNVIVCDLKTTADASPTGFATSIAKFKYHMQAAFYLEAAFSALSMPSIASKEDPNPKYTQKFYFLCIEKKPPYAVGVYPLSSDALAQGARQIQEAMNIYLKYRGRTDPWPGYRDIDAGQPEIVLDLPYWARDPFYPRDELGF